MSDVSSGKLQVFEQTARLGQDLFIPFGPVEIYEGETLVDTIDLDKTKCTFIAEENGISWDSASGNIVDDPDGNLAIFCGKTPLAAFGKISIKGTLFIDEAVNRREPYCDFLIKIQ